MDSADRTWHAYWLTPDAEANPEYVTLLLTRGPVELQVAGEKASPAPTDDELLQARALTVKTYARDSIWNTDSRPFKPARLEGVERQRQTVMIDGKRFGYHAVELPVVVALLQKPEGTIPIHRIWRATAGVESFIPRLVKALQAP